MNHIILFVSLLFLSCNSCKNKENTPFIVSGHVNAYGTSQPVESARLIITGLDNHQHPFITDTVLTDSKGLFYAAFDTETAVNQISIQADKRGYFGKTITDQVFSNRPFDLLLDPEGLVRIEAIPDLDGGSVAFSGTFSNLDGWTVHVFDTPQSWIFTARGNRMHAITHKTWDDGYVIRSDSFYVSANDTTLYTIHF